MGLHEGSVGTSKKTENQGFYGMGFDTGVGFRVLWFVSSRITLIIRGGL